MLEAYLRVMIQLRQPISLKNKSMNLNQQDAQLRASLFIPEEHKFGAGSTQINIENSEIALDYTQESTYKTIKEVCIQPVRFASQSLQFEWPLSFSMHTKYTGENYATIMRELHRQGAQDDVFFTVAPWKTLITPTRFSMQQYSTATTKQAMDTLADYDNPDCIEIVFVDNMKNTLQRTEAAGMASSKVFINDEMLGKGARGHLLKNLLNIVQTTQLQSNPLYTFRFAYIMSRSVLAES